MKIFKKPVLQNKNSVATKKRSSSKVCFFILILWLLASLNEHKIAAQATQGQTVTGIVTDAVSGQPIAGVAIQVKGTLTGAISQTDGTYTVKIPNDATTLVFNFIGYLTEEVIIEGKTVINVILTETITSLDDVVVVGYGVQKKVSLTSAVSPIEGEILTSKTVSNVQQTLQGNIAGLTVMDLGASPGKANMVMRVRGVTTLSGNDPLVIVDGIEQNLTDINPNDIESISVLKDASSTAIYGSRASNGVILITTKRAKSGKLAVSLNSYYAFQKGNNEWEHMGLRDYMELQNVAWTNSYGSPTYTEEYINEYVNATDRLKYPLPNTWYDHVFSTAPQLSNTLSVSGGTDNLKAMLNIRYLDQDGIIHNSNAKISEIRLNTDYKVNSKISIATDINYRYKKILAPLNESRVIRQILQNSQWAVPIYPDGTFGITADGYSPLVYEYLDGTRWNYEDYIVGNLKGDWEMLKGLKLTIQFSTRATMNKEKAFKNSYQVRDYYDNSIVRLNSPINNLTETRNDAREFTLNNLLNYSRTFGDHSINVLAGYSQIQNQGSLLNAFRQQFYSNDVQSLTLGANDATKNNSGTDSEWALRSFFGRFNYTFKDKYMFEANVRRDGSSRFTGDKVYSTFPSFSAGWRISQEEFWTNFRHIAPDLKIRASYGKSGNQAVGLYSYMATYDLQSYSFNNVSVPGYRQVNLANNTIGWETTSQLDIGTDIQLLSNRISLSIDYYHKKTDDILLNLPVPGTLGLNPCPQNAGRVDNTGWDFLLNLKNNFEKFTVSSSFNLNINKNEVMDLAGTGPYITGGAESRYITQEGLPINSWWGYRTDGYFQTDEEVANYPTSVPGTKPGDVKFLDINHDGQISPADMQYLGRSFPKYTFGGNLSVSYKGFVLSMMLQGAAGYKARVGGALAEMGIWGGFTHKIVSDNYWTPENRNARFPRPLKYDLRNINMADRDLLNGNYLRLKNVQLLYNLPTKITGIIGLDAVSVYVSTTNLLTFSELNDFDVDPETQIGSRAEVYPQTSTTTFGLNINF